MRLAPVLLVLGLTQSSLLACSCFLPPLEEMVANSDLVAQAKVLDGRVLEESRQYLANFELVKVWKGEVGERFQLLTPHEGTFCDLEFQVGVEYLLFANSREGEWRSGVCSGTRPIREDLPFMDPRPKLDQILETGAAPPPGIPSGGAPFAPGAAAGQEAPAAPGGKIQVTP